jgi:hypothetical protein
VNAEPIFRWLFIAIFVAMSSISVAFRRKARQSGEVIPRAREGAGRLLLRFVFAAPLYLGILAYMLNPAWMAWSSVPVPAWVRWLGAALGLAMVPLVPAPTFLALKEAQGWSTGSCEAWAPT